MPKTRDSCSEAALVCQWCGCWGQLHWPTKVFSSPPRNGPIVWQFPRANQEHTCHTCPEPTPCAKSTNNVDLWFQVTTRSRYLGGYIGSRAGAGKGCFFNKCGDWPGLCGPQSPKNFLCWAAEVAAAQMAFVQRVINNIGDCFSKIKDSISN
jgi:hypothetical protein